MRYLLLLLFMASSASAQTYNPYSQEDNLKKAQKEYGSRNYCPDGSQSVNGQCRGYVAVPARPIECGGATASYNMKWEKEGNTAKKDCSKSNNN